MNAARPRFVFTELEEPAERGRVGSSGYAKPSSEVLEYLSRNWFP
jgi:hypothetical protein